MAAPQEFSAIANVMLAAPLPFVPAERRGQLVIIAVDVLRGPGRGRREGSRATLSGAKTPTGSRRCSVVLVDEPAENVAPTDRRIIALSPSKTLIRVMPRCARTHE
jgi:hypothetical protein